MERRTFIGLTSFGAAGWLISQLLPVKALAAARTAGDFRPHPLICLREDGSIIIYVMKQEMGQGVQTSLPLILAEELEADPSKIIVETLAYNDTNADEYNTWGSASILTGWLPLRNAGAAAREMLCTAAANEWQIAITQCKAENGQVINQSNGQSFSYAALMQKAASLPVPAHPALKDPKDFTRIGRRQKKNNVHAIVSGKNAYGMDMRLPGMLYATVVRSPVYKGRIKSWDDTAVKQLEGVVHVMEITPMGDGVDNRSGVAIVATNTWTALRAQQLLKPIWEPGANAAINSAALSLTLRQALKKDKPVLILDEQNTSATLPVITDPNAFSAVYELPFLAHAAMEPLNCTAWYKDGQYTIWGGFQAPGIIADILPKAFGVSPKHIFVHLLPMGGAFGRKEKVDNAAAAMQISKATGRPIQVIFSRPDDMQADFYRPASFHRLTAVTDKQGIRIWQHQQAITTFPEVSNGKPISFPHDGIGGAMGDFYYPTGTFRAAFYSVKAPVPIGSWRSIGYNHNIFVIECFIDELAARQHMDPVAYRLQLLKKITVTQLAGHLPFNPQRLIAVLEKCSELIGWTSKKSNNRFRGIALCPYLHSHAYAAHAFEISINAEKEITIHQAVCVLDCGLAVDPDGLEAQIEGSLAWALSATLKGEITLTDGVVDQQSFAQYDVARMPEMPPFKIHVMQSQEAPGGAGETCVPSVAPALCNAIAAATGKRIRKLPLQSAGYRIHT
jgi:isoquinoline 1-oxidoreductase beta subunit